MLSLSAEVGSRPTQATHLVEFLEKEARELKWDEREQFAIRLALHEALTNAIKHAHEGDPKKRITIECAITHRAFRIVIQDRGEHFDRSAVPDPTSPEFLERPSGRGLLLMEWYMSRVDYEQNDTGNCIRMLLRKGEAPVDVSLDRSEHRVLAVRIERHALRSGFSQSRARSLRSEVLGALNPSHYDQSTQKFGVKFRFEEDEVIVIVEPRKGKEKIEIRKKKHNGRKSTAHS